MTEEINVGGGVLVPGLLLWLVVAMLAGFPVRWLLFETGFYRFVWHKGLFDICLFIIIWGATAALASRWP
jgi:hypothetical protein